MASRNSYCDFNLNGGKLLTAGFEEVNSLPTTNLFAGREVFYNGQLYVYNGGQWTSQLDPLQKYNATSSGIATPLDVLNANSSEAYVGNAQIVEVASLLAGQNCTSLFDDVITMADALVEFQDAGSDIWTQERQFYKTLTLGQKLRLTANNKDDVRALSLMRPGAIFMIYIPHNYRQSHEQVTIEYLTWTNATGDGDMNNADNYIWWTVYQKTLPSTNYWIYPLNREIYPNSVMGGIKGTYYIHNIRITVEMTHTDSTAYPNTLIEGCNIYTTKQVTAKTTPVYLNYDAVIKPTQSTKTYKTIEWVLQYLGQGVNWLRDNHLPLSGGTLSGDIKAPQFIVPNGTASQFLKADGSLDSNAYTLHADLNSVKNNAWKLDIANPECETVVIALQQGQGIFEAMAKAGIDYLKSRNIYVDLSEISSIGGGSIIDNLFSGYENLPVGVRYHIFFGNVQSSVKIYWLKPIESNIPYRVVGLTSDYPTAKCEFLRVTTDWTYADWEAAINQVDFSLDTGTASESDNSTLVNYMDNNKVSYTKTPKGALVNITTLLAALAGSK